MKQSILCLCLRLLTLILLANLSVYAQDAAQNARQNLIDGILKQKTKQVAEIEVQLKEKSLFFIPKRKNQDLIVLANDKLANSLVSGAQIKKTEKNVYLVKSLRSESLVKLNQLSVEQIGMRSPRNKVGQLISFENYPKNQFLVLLASKSGKKSLSLDKIFKVQKTGKKTDNTSATVVTIAKSDYQRINGPVFKNFETLTTFYKYLYKTTDAALNLSRIIASSSLSEDKQDAEFEKFLAIYTKSSKELNKVAEKLGVSVADELTLLHLLTQESAEKIPENKGLIQKLEEQIGDKAVGSYQKKVVEGGANSKGAGANNSSGKQESFCGGITCKTGESCVNDGRVFRCSPRLCRNCKPSPLQVCYNPGNSINRYQCINTCFGISCPKGQQCEMQFKSNNFGDRIPTGPKCVECPTCENIKGKCPESTSCVNKANPAGSTCPVTPTCECSYGTSNPSEVKVACYEKKQGPCPEGSVCTSAWPNSKTGCLEPHCRKTISCSEHHPICKKDCKTCKMIETEELDDRGEKKSRPQCVDFDPPKRKNDKYPEHTKQMCTACPEKERECYGKVNGVPGKSICCNVDLKCGINPDTKDVKCCPPEGCCPELGEPCKPWEVEKIETDDKGCKKRICNKKCDQEQRTCELYGKIACCELNQSCGLKKIDGGGYEPKCCGKKPDCPKGQMEIYDTKDEYLCPIPICKPTCNQEKVCPEGKKNGEDGITCCPTDNTCGYNGVTDVCCPPIETCKEGFDGTLIRENGCDKMLCTPTTEPSPTPSNSKGLCLCSVGTNVGLCIANGDARLGGKTGDIDCSAADSCKSYCGIENSVCACDAGKSLGCWSKGSLIFAGHKPENVEKYSSCKSSAECDKICLPPEPSLEPSKAPSQAPSTMPSKVPPPNETPSMPPSSSNCTGEAKIECPPPLKSNFTRSCCLYSCNEEVNAEGKKLGGCGAAQSN